MAVFEQNGIGWERPFRLFGCAIGSLLILTTSAASAAGPITFLGFDKSQMSEEAGAGMDEIFSGRMFNSGMPQSVMKAMMGAGSGSPEELGYDPNTPEGKYYSGSKLPAPDFRPAGLNLSDSVFEKDGVALANGNCFGCHAGMVDGKVVAGLGNNRMLPRVKSKGKPDMAGMMTLMASLTDKEKKIVAERMKGMKGTVLITPDSASRGAHFGPFAVWSVSSRIADPAKTGLLISNKKTELSEIVATTMVPPVDPMPWWLMKYKKRGYWYSDSSPHSAKDFSMNFTTIHENMNENHAAHVESTAKALAFARETQSPIYPQSLDAELVKKGANLFHGRVKPANRKGFISCKTCHGTYTKNASNPDFGVPGSWKVAYNHSAKFRNVKTDPTYNEVLQKFRPITEHMEKLLVYYEAQGTPELAPQASVPDKKGYIAPALVGVWASAPYFHNGSVPTITAVLNSKERPEIWTRNFSDPNAYDFELIGLEHAAITRSEFDESATKAADANPKSKASIDHRSIYDTAGFGQANTGHTFGDNLSDAERGAVIEFLKSLSGPDMVPAQSQSKEKSLAGNK